MNPDNINEGLKASAGMMSEIRSCDMCSPLKLPVQRMAESDIDLDDEIKIEEGLHRPTC